MQEETLAGLVLLGCWVGEHRCPGFKPATPMSGSEDRGNIVPSFLPRRSAQGFAPFLLVSSFPDFQTCSSAVNSVSFLPPSFLDVLPLPPSKHCLALLSRLSYLDGEDCGEWSSTHLTSFPHGDPVFLAASQWCPSFALWPQHLWVLLSILGHMPGHLQALFHSLPS